jgi:3-hydroxybutyryl-CoA dehydrogenase
MTQAANYNRDHPIVLIGHGTIGSTILTGLIIKGIRVHVWDNNPLVVKKTPAAVSDRLRLLHDLGVLPDAQAPYKNVGVIQNLEEFDAVLRQNPYLVLEAIDEDLQKKRELLSYVSDRVNPCTIIATNTSSLPPAELSTAVRHPDHFVFWHFTNPADVTDIVEFGAADRRTSPTTVEEVKCLCKTMGKHPIRIHSYPAAINSIQFGAIDAAMRTIHDLAGQPAGSPMSVDDIRRYAPLVDNMFMEFIPLWLAQGVFSDATAPKVQGIDDRHTAYLWDRIVGAARGLEGRVASREHVGMVMEMHANRWGSLGGVFRVVDAGGPKVFRDIYDVFVHHWHMFPQTDAPTILSTIVDAGLLGWKTPETGGFYQYRNDEIPVLSMQLTKRWVDLLNKQNP